MIDPKNLEAALDEFGQKAEQATRQAVHNMISELECTVYGLDTQVRETTGLEIAGDLLAEDNEIAWDTDWNTG